MSHKSNGFSKSGWGSWASVVMLISLMVSSAPRGFAAPTSITCSAGNTSINVVFNVTYNATDAADNTKYIIESPVGKTLSTGPGSGITFTPQADNQTVTIAGFPYTPGAKNNILETGNTVKVTVQAGFRDAAGDALVGTLSTACAVKDTTPPLYTTLTTNNQSIIVQYNEAMNTNDVRTATNYTATIIKTPAGTTVSYNIDLSSASIVYDVVAFNATIKNFVIPALGNSTTLPTGYTVQVKVTGVRDTSGNTIVDDGVNNVHTAVVQDTTPPVVQSCKATANPTDTSPYSTSQIIVTFSKEVQSGGGANAADNIGNYTVESPVGTKLNAGKVVYTPGLKSATLSLFTTTDGRNSPVAVVDHTTFKVTVVKVKDTAAVPNAIVENGSTNTCTGVVSVPPKIDSCAGGNTSVSVIYNEPMTQDSALTSVANYTLQSPTRTAVPILSVGYDPVKNTATLFLSPSNYLITGNTYTVKVTGVRDRDDRDGNTANFIPNDGVANVCSGIVQDNIPPVVFYTAADTTHVKLIFNEDVNTDDARSTASYTIMYWVITPTTKDVPCTSPDPYAPLQVKSVVFDEGTRSALLTVSPFPMTGLYTLYRVGINGIRDIAGNRSFQLIGDWPCTWYIMPQPPGAPWPGAFDIDSFTPRKVGDGDFTPPFVAACASDDDQVAGITKFVVNYSENVKADLSVSAANTLANYQLESPPGTIINLADPNNQRDPKIGITLTYTNAGGSFAATLTGVKDDVVPAGQQYKLTVTNVQDFAGNVIVKDGVSNVCSGTISTRQPPIVSSCGEIDVTSVTVFFSPKDKVNPTDAATITNFTLETGPVGGPYKAIPLSSPAQTATYDASKNMTTLAGLNLTPGNEIRITVRNVKDLSGNVIVDNGVTNVCKLVVVDNTPPKVTTCLGKPNQIQIFFSKQVNAADAQTVANYSLEIPAGNPVNLAGAAITYAFDNIKNTSIATIQGLTFVVGNNYKITVVNLRDVAAPPNTIRNDGVSNVCQGSILENTPPTVVGCAANNTSVSVTFSKNVNATDATTGGNFTVESPVGQPISLATASLAYNPVSHTTGITNIKLITNLTFKVTAINVNDLASNTIVNNGTTNVCQGKVADSTPPTVVSCGGDNNKVTVTFSKTLQLTQAQDAANYALESPTGTPVNVPGGSVLYDATSSTATLSGLTLTTGASFKIAVINVKDAADNVIINNGTTNVCTGTVQDKTPPVPTGCAATKNSVSIFFSKSVLGGGGANAADNIGNYRLESPTGTLVFDFGSQPAGVSVIYNDATRKATISGISIKEYDTFKILVKNVKDLAGNTIVNDGTTNSCAGTVADTTPPTIVDQNLKCTVKVNTTTLAVTYSEAVNQSDATNKANFTFESPIGTVVDLGLASLAYVQGSNQTVIDLSKVTPALVDQNTFKLTVRNVRDLAGNVMADNGTTNACTGTVQKGLDLTPPQLTCNPPTTPSTPNDTSVALSFNKAMDKASAETAANYKIAPTLAVKAAALNNADPTKVTLTTDFQTFNQTYTITVTGVKDTNGNGIQTKNSCTFVGTDTTPPTLKSCTAPLDSQILLVFSEPVDDTSLSLTNFTITPTLSVTAAARLNAPNTNQVLLTTAQQVAGTNYSVTVSGVKDLAGNSIDQNTDPKTKSCSFLAIDTTPPSIVACEAGGKSVRVTFSEKVVSDTSATGARNAGNYALESPTGTAIAFATVDQDPVNPVIFVLRGLSATLKVGDSFKVTAKNIADISPQKNVIKTGQGDTCSGTVKQLPAVIKWAASLNAVSITFSEQMIASDAQDLTKFQIFSPASSSTPVDKTNAKISYIFCPGGLSLTHITGVVLPGPDFRVSVTGVRRASDSAALDPDQSGGAGAVQFNPATVLSGDSNGTKVAVVFSRSVTKADAELKANYAVESPAGSGIFRDISGVTIAYTDLVQLAVISFSNTSLSNGSTFQVYAANIDSQGPMLLSSGQGTVNTTPLSVANCIPHETGLQIKFSRPAVKQDAEARSDPTKTNDDYYKIESPIGTAISINGARITYDNTTTTATISGIAWSVGATFKCTVQNLVRDQFLTAISAPTTCPFNVFIVPDETPPIVRCDYISADETKVVVAFTDGPRNGNVESTTDVFSGRYRYSASNPDNYQITDTTAQPNVIIRPRTVSYSNVGNTFFDASTATLTNFDNPLVPGHLIKVTVSNVTDLTPPAPPPGNAIKPNPSVCTNVKVFDSRSPSVLAYKDPLCQSCQATRSRLVVQYSRDVTGADVAKNYVLDNPIGTFIDLTNPNISITYDPKTHQAALDFSKLPRDQQLKENENFRLKVLANDPDGDGVKDPGETGVAAADPDPFGRFLFVRQDGSNNILIDVVLDTTPPFLTGIKASVDKVEINFSENVNSGDAVTQTFYKLTDTTTSTDISLANTTLTYDPVAFKTTITGLSLTAGNTLQVKAVAAANGDSIRDMAGNKLDPTDPANTQKVMIGAIKVVGATAGNSFVKVVFGEKALQKGPNSATDPAMFTLQSPIGTNVSLTGATLSYGPSTRTTTIDGLSLTTGASFKIVVGAVRTESGNATPAVSPPDNTASGVVADTTAPTIVSCDARTSAATKLTVTYSKPMLADGSANAADNKANYTVTSPAGGAQNLVTSVQMSVDKSIATLTLTNPLTGGRNYQIVVTATVTDTASPTPNTIGNLNNTCSGTVVDDLPPTIASCDARTSSLTNVTVTFSKAMLADQSANAANNKANYTVTSPAGGAPNVVTAVQMSADSKSATLVLTTALTAGQTYQVVVAKNVTDTAQPNPNPIGGVNNTCSGTVKDDVLPTLVSCDAKASASTKITVTFSKAMLSDGTANAVNTVANYTVTSPPGGAQDTVTAAQVSADNKTVVLTVSGPLPPGQSYKVVVASAVTDAASPTPNPIGNVNNTCTNNVRDDVPIVVGCDAKASAAKTVTVTFSKPMLADGSANAANVGANYTVTGSAGGPVNKVTAVQMSADGKTATLSLTTALTAGQSYQVVVTGTVTDALAIPIGNGNNVCNGSVKDDIPPVVVSCDARASSVRTITVTFSKVMLADNSKNAANTKTNYTVTSPAGNTPNGVTGVQASTDNKSVTLTLANPLVAGQTYQVIVARTVTDAVTPTPNPIGGDPTANNNSCSGTVKDDIPPTLKDCSATTTSVSVTYSKTVKDADKITNYTVVNAQTNATLVGSAAAFDDKTMTATISGLSLSVGIPVTVTVNNVTDMSGNPLDPKSNSLTCLVPFSISVRGGTSFNQMVTFPATPPKDQDQATFLKNLFSDASGQPVAFKLAQWIPTLNGGAGGYVLNDNGQFQLVIGQGYWAQAISSLQLKFTKGVTAQQDQDFHIPLPSNNWAILGNPFPVRMNWDVNKLKYQYAGKQDVLLNLKDNPSRPLEFYGWFWDPVRQDYIIVCDPKILSFVKTYLDPGECAFIRSYGSGVDFVVPAMSSSGFTLGAALDVARDSQRRRPRTPTGNNWSVQLTAQAGDLQNSGNLFGINTSLSDGLRITNPPPGPSRNDYVELAFLETDTRDQRTVGKELKVDIRSRGAARQQWNAVVSTPVNNQEVVVQWGNLTQVPKQYRLRLVDLTTGKRVAMRTATSYTFRSNTRGLTQRPFTIEVYPEIEGGVRISNLSVDTPGRSLTGRVRIAYSLSRGAEVEIKILNANGRVVRSFAVGKADAGINAAFWDGRGNRGEILPRGLYIVQISGRDEEGQAFQAVRSVNVR